MWWPYGRSGHAEGYSNDRRDPKRLKYRRRHDQVNNIEVGGLKCESVRAFGN
jgi:hypothetical protein